jgi:recombinational DNA repair protein RecT
MKTYAPLSIEMQQAVEADEKVAVTDEDGNVENYVDVEFEETTGNNFENTADGRKVDTESGEIIP